MADGIKVDSFVEEFDANAELFDLDSSRQNCSAAQRQTSSVLLFGVDAGYANQAGLDYACLDARAQIGMPVKYRGTATHVSRLLPNSSQFVRDLCRDYDGIPGRAVIASLAPGDRIHRHKDDQLYWLLRDRYHLVVKAGEIGSHFRAGDEEVYMREGELWWFDPTVYHEAHNKTDKTYVHLVMDVFSKRSLKSYLTRLRRYPLSTTYRSVCSLFESDDGLRDIAGVVPAA